MHTYSLTDARTGEFLGEFRASTATRAIQAWARREGYTLAEVRAFQGNHPKLATIDVKLVPKGRKAGGMAKLTGEKKRAFLARMAKGRREAGIGTGKKKPRKKGRKAGAAKASGKPRKKGLGKRAGRMTVGPAIMPRLHTIASGKSGKTPAALHASVTTLAKAQVATVGKVIELDSRMGAVEGWMAGRKRLGSG